MTMLQQAIEHYKYGISHDIFSEPVTSYAKIAVDALEKQNPQKIINKDYFYGYVLKCPVCGQNIHEGAYGSKANYCYECGQALDWSD